MVKSGKNIVLTGFMGTGKTVVGRAIAQTLDREFVDMDTLIEQREGMTIPEIFTRYGEAYFRERERELCRELARRRNLVIATGGGALIPGENLRALTETSTVICLTCDLEEILRRLNGDENRPMLWGGDWRERVRTLLEHRKAAYDRIPYHVDTTHLTVEEVVKRVLLLSDTRFTTPLRIPVTTPMGSYEILFGEGALNQVGELLSDEQIGARIAVVADENAWEFHGAKLESNLRRGGLDPLVIRLPSGEQHKTLETVSFLYDRFIEGGLDRQGAVLAFGGGVVGDVAGFAAATYLRGVPLLQLPTTLLAMVDSSIGGKVGVDHPRGKNLVGAFVRPLAVLTDPRLLDTLPPAELRCGLAEIVKAGIIGSPALFRHLESRGTENLAWIIWEAIQVKVGVVEEDPYERGRRAVLNLGHTFAHGLELVSGYHLRHGEAVAIGMIVACLLAEQIGLCSTGLVSRVENVLVALGLPTRYKELSPADVWQAMATDKKRRGKRLRYVLPRNIGDVIVTSKVTKEQALRALEEVRA